MGVVRILGVTKRLNTGIPTIDRENNMTTNLQSVLESNKQLQEQLRLALGRIGDLEKQEKARTASVYKSNAGNLTFSWRKAGVFRSFLIPSKAPDGKISISRCGNVPADIRLNGNSIEIRATLPVDGEEAQLFNQAFTMQNQVIIVSKAKDGQTTTGTTPTTPQLPVSPAYSQPSVPVAPTAPAYDPGMLVAEAQKLIDSGIPFPSLADAVASVKKAKGLA